MNDFWWAHTVQAQPLLGIDANGDRFGSPVDVPCWFDDETRLVTSATGEETTSNSTVYAALDKAEFFPVGSKVTTPTGMVRRVLTLDIFDSGALELAVEHIEVALT